MKPYYEQNGVEIYCGDARDVLRTRPDGIVRCCVTSPPYFGLRDYGVEGQIGLEQSPDEYIAHLVEVFREVRRVLADDGTLWLNLGDTYAGSGRGGNPEDSPHQKQRQNKGSLTVVGRDTRQCTYGLKQKDLLGIPWRVAFALQKDGWYLRQDIIWHKPNPMPESVQDRCTKAHEYIFLLSKSPRYYFDAEAVKEKSVTNVRRLSLPTSEYKAGKTPSEVVGRNVQRGGKALAYAYPNGLPYRNIRSVWTLTTHSYPGAHFATFPPALPERCIKAGSTEGDVVLDPFCGSGTVAEVARKWGRRFIGIELNPDYIDLAAKRLAQGVLFAS